jgi:hypothetical protein
MSEQIEVSEFGNNLIFKRGYTKAFVHSILKKRKLNGIKINTRWEKVDNLEFLADYDFLESLEIVGMGDFDFQFLGNLKQLRQLSLNISGTKVIDLNGLENLEELSLLWRRGKVIGLGSCKNITSMCLIDYSERDLTLVSTLLGLNSLQIKTSSIETLFGVEHLTKLKNLLLGNCKKLTSLSGLEKLNSLLNITLDLCPKIKDLSTLANLIKLENIQIIDCKEIDSIRFVKNLYSLKRLALLGSTNVLDGDITPAIKVKDFVYKTRRHYNVEIQNVENEALVKKNSEKIKAMFKNNE